MLAKFLDYASIYNYTFCIIITERFRLILNNEHARHFPINIPQTITTLLLLIISNQCFYIYISQSSGRSFINRFEIFIDIWLIFYINIFFYIQHQFDNVDHSTVSVEVMFDVCFVLLEYDDTILIALGINLKYTIESAMHVLVPRKRWKMQSHQLIKTDNIMTKNRTYTMRRQTIPRNTW